MHYELVSAAAVCIRLQANLCMCLPGCLLQAAFSRTSSALFFSSGGSVDL